MSDAFEDTPAYDKLVDRAEQAAQELDFRAGRGEIDERLLADASREELESWAHWDPEQEDSIIKDLGDGITLRRPKPRSTARRRLKAEPEGDMPEEPAEPSEPAEPRERAPRSHHRAAPPPKRKPALRIEGATGLNHLIGALGLALVMTGRDPGVGLALQFEAPIAGAKIDGAIAGTPLDRLVVQPLARVGKMGRDAGSVLALPFLVGLIERRPELYPLLKEPLLRPLVTEMAIELQQAGQEAERRLSEAQREGSGVLIDSDSLLAQLFEGRPEPGPGAGRD